MKKFLIKSINWYQRDISYFLELKNIRCKYYPTCSEYTKQAIEKYGSIKGTSMGISRFIRCNPFCKGGYDPVK